MSLQKWKKEAVGFKTHRLCDWQHCYGKSTHCLRGIWLKGKEIRPVRKDEQSLENCQEFFVSGKKSFWKPTKLGQLNANCLPIRNSRMMSMSSPNCCYFLFSLGFKIILLFHSLSLSSYRISLLFFFSFCLKL